MKWSDLPKCKPHLEIVVVSKGIPEWIPREWIDDERLRWVEVTFCETPKDAREIAAYVTENDET